MGTPTYSIDTGLYQFCTVRQLEILEAINKHKSKRAASRAIGIDYKQVHQAVDLVKKKAGLQGYSPEHGLTHHLAPGHKSRGYSNYYNKDGILTGQWLKADVDAEQRETIIKAAIAALLEDTPRLPPMPGPVHAIESLCNLVTLTDVHVGMYAWGRETGADWDLTIAEREVSAAVDHLFLACPPAGTAIVAQLGDFIHQDGQAAVTPASGHNLDSDSRFSKIVQVAIRILRRTIDVALQRHKRVVVLIAEGNHDPVSSIWLRHMFVLLYEREPRVSIIDSDLPYYVHQHGKTMIGWHHGHLKKVDQLPLLFAAQFPAVWGATTKRYVHSGHLHHKHEKEHSGITVIQHPTIAARDAYAARGGWVADREMTAITYSDKFGQVARATVCPEMLEAAVQPA